MEKNIFEVKDYFHLRQRTEYAQGIESFLQANKKSAQSERNELFRSADRETLRKKYIDMLGFPLNRPDLYTHKIRAKYEPLGIDDDFVMERVQLEILPDFWFYGVLYKPKNAAKKCALAIAQHGGEGTAEIVGSLEMNSANYNHMVRRIKRDDLIVFAPQLFLWSKRYGDERDERGRYGREFQQLGGSITAFEVFCIRRCLDYFSGLDCIDENKIGMIGLSYGGMYTLYTAAADTRIKSALSSCFFNDRFIVSWQDFVYFNQARTFFDAEIAALVYPRALFIEVADKDAVFTAESAQSEAKRLFELLKKEKTPANIVFQVFSGVHELNPKDDGIHFFLENLFN
jgi:hypothetical protein